MNIKQNIVRIKTASQVGSGIIYPCEINQNKYEKSEYIIFTNRHLLEDIEFNETDPKLLMDIDIYDNYGELIDIHHKSVNLRVFVPEPNEKQKTEDIAAILLIFDYELNLNLETRILYDDTNLDTIFIEGFPQILHDNDISSKLQLEGRYKSVYPINHKIGIFQILDDYHWYSNYKDLRLLQGFSGGPVYSIEENNSFIVGMNHSTLNIESGENPFKLLYYYKFDFVLKYLRKQGCIIFNRNSDQSVDIKWMYKLEQNHDAEDNLNLLLLGSSGSGKSSFAKTFLLHSDLIDSTNDGQTTRSNVIYEISLFNPKPKITIQFLTKERFLSRMEQLNYENYLLGMSNLLENNQSKSLKDYIQRKYIQKQDNTEKDRPQKRKLTAEILYSDNNNVLLAKDNTEKLFSLAQEYIEEDITKEFENFNSFLSNNKQKIVDILCNVEGFFHVSEFDFLDPISVDQEIPNDKSLSDYFDEFYKMLFEKIKTVLKHHKLVVSNDYTLERNFDEGQDRLKWIPFCLQVKDKGSLTGIVDFVHIEDSVSNEYASILNDLNVRNLKIIDTYGLDHANWEQGQQRVLSNILYNLQDKKLVQFNSDLAIVYIKKLDSGKPTELKNIIPQIYHMIPQAPVYCVFNGLDIFLGDRVGDFIEFDYSNPLQEIPKSIKYLMSEEGRREIVSFLGSKNYLSENMYNTLKNNIIAFCSNEKIIQEYYTIYNNNRREIYKLLLSIKMKEYSSMSIIPQEFISDLEEEKYDDVIKEMIKTIFSKASKTDWDVAHWKTRGANYRRISAQTNLGYWGTYQHQWNQLFHKGYVDTILEKSFNFLKIEGNPSYASAVDSCIKNMEEKFLGPPRQLFESKVDESPKSQFRTLIEKMYEEGCSEKIYQSNPFGQKQEGGKNAEENNFLNDVCDFSKGYPLIEEDLLTHFKKCLLASINDDNKSKSYNLLKINNNFFLQFQKLEYEFRKKYNNSLYEFLKYYLENSNKTE